MIDASGNSPNWDVEMSRPATKARACGSTNPPVMIPLCPGGDWSRYLCDGCERYVTPFLTMPVT